MTMVFDAATTLLRLQEDVLKDLAKDGRVERRKEPEY